MAPFMTEIGKTINYMEKEDIKMLLDNLGKENLLKAFINPNSKFN